MLRRALTALVLLGSLGVAPVAAQAEQVYPACFVVSTYGTGTKNTGAPASGKGTGTLTLEATYTDTTNRFPDGVHVDYTNNSTYKSGASSSDYNTTLTVNGVLVTTTPKTGYSPGYFVHNSWWGGWSQGGLWHPWVKGDLVVARVNVTLYPTLNNGYTEATCRL